MRVGVLRKPRMCGKGIVVEGGSSAGVEDDIEAEG